jgi:hypothetical protein
MNQQPQAAQYQQPYPQQQPYAQHPHAQAQAGQLPTLVYPLHGFVKVFLIILGIATIPLFLIGLIVLKVAFQKLVLEPHQLVIKTIYTKRIPYTDIVGIRWLNSNAHYGTVESTTGGTIGLELRGKKHPFTVPITKFANTDDFLAQLGARTGHPVRPRGT